MADAILERMKDMLSKLYSEYRPYEGRDAFDGYQDELEHGIRELLVLTALEYGNHEGLEPQDKFEREVKERYGC